MSGGTAHIQHGILSELYAEKCRTPTGHGHYFQINWAAHNNILAAPRLTKFTPFGQRSSGRRAEETKYTKFVKLNK